ncbi:MAG: KH domain-containing protein [Desulfobacterium sp.]
MGQKVNPIGLRLGIIKTWDSRWYADKEYADFVYEDYKIRKFLKKKLYHAGISKIEIERFSKRIRLRVFAARPGIIIGKKGSEIALLKKELGVRFLKYKYKKIINNILHQFEQS